MARLAQHLHTLGPVDDQGLLSELHWLTGILLPDHRQFIGVTALETLENVAEHVVHH